MEINSSVKENNVFIQLNGNLLGENANGPVLDFIKEKLAAHKNFAIDLSDVKYINSTGLGMFISAQVRINNAGGKLALYNMPENILKLLKMMKLDATFLIVNSEEDAINALK